ncbi:hypothetical protein SAMN02745181_0375 [Rubritalea squalenifaciens DSM 18772]|uniref:Uncharacterized protein n=1 Tax=Rubritalea squalenifaciens DSM 18772 TaxID=1123071 RepID=A0A1M6C302_9BACT|nr:hypothetical protein [Rubritalea squalenifaciens]SHI55425.1 hypothetical protein SAMN02745181_0375 [Rubritalea squalenifaciens DSM 18772]
MKIFSRLTYQVSFGITVAALLAVLIGDLFYSDLRAPDLMALAFFPLIWAMVSIAFTIPTCLILLFVPVARAIIRLRLLLANLAGAGLLILLVNGSRAVDAIMRV